MKAFFAAALLIVSAGAMADFGVGKEKATLVQVTVACTEPVEPVNTANDCEEAITYIAEQAAADQLDVTLEYRQVNAKK